MRFEIRMKMISIEAQYFSLTRNIMFATGLWPYHRTMFTQFQCIFIFGILMSAVILHLSPFLIAECTLNVIIEILSFALIFVIYVIKYNMFWINNDSMRYTLEQLQRICDELKDKNEFAIIEKYGNITRRYSIGLAICLVDGIVIFSLVQSLPNILDVALPRNESRPRQLIFPVEYFLDPKYFYLVRFNTNVTICLGDLIVIGITSSVVAILEYFCGMFAVVSYRIERAMRIEILQNVSNENLISEGIISAVDIHRKTIKLSEFVILKFEMMFILLILVGVINVSLNLFRIFQIVSSGVNGEILFPCVFVFIMLCYMFLINYLGQCFTNHNSYIFSTVYNIRWYEAPLHVQKLILFLLQKGIKEYNIKIAGGLVTASLQCFVTLTNTSLSYFTLMYSVQR